MEKPRWTPHDRSFSGAGTEKRPLQDGMNHNGTESPVKYKIKKI
jgi:hypothetical protein